MGPGTPRRGEACGEAWRGEARGEGGRSGGEACATPCRGEAGTYEGMGMPGQG